MKRTLLYLVVLVFTALSVKGQNDYSWQVLSSTGTGLFSATSNTYSVAYFKGATFGSDVVPARIYVATREGAGIDVLNAQTGAFVKNIPTAGTGYKNTKIRVTESGEIYSIAMKLGAAASSDGQLISVNYFSNELSTPVALSFPYPSGAGSLNPYPRMGDSFDIAGTGNNAVFFVGGSGSSYVFVFKRNGNAVDFVRSINLGGDLAAFSISIVPNETDLTKSDFFASHNTTSVLRKYFKYNSGTDTYTGVTLPTKVHDQSTANNFSQIKYFKVADQDYIATSGGSTDGSKLLKIFKITGADYGLNTSFELVKTLTGGSYINTTGNGGFSDLVVSNPIVKASDFVSGKFELELYQLVTRNAISQYKLEFKADGTLPVSLSSFNASLKNGASTLSWSTSSESNSKGFEIQRSTDGKEFKVIDFVSSKAENGNSSSVINYSYVDQSATSGTNYYRLNQIDLNGNSKIHDVKAINVGLGSISVKVYPNPVSSNVKVKAVDFKGLKYDLYDSSGKMVLSAKASSEITEISISELIPSIYILKVIKSGEVIDSRKIVKQ